MYRQKYDFNLKMASPGHKDAKLGVPEVKSDGHRPTNGPPVLTDIPAWTQIYRENICIHYVPDLQPTESFLLLLWK